MKSNQKVVPHIPWSSNALAGLAAQVPHIRVPAAASPGGCLEEFSYMPDGSLHLQKGITLTAVQAARVMKLKKPTLVVKETAQCIWTQAGLAARSVSGVLAPKKNSGEEPKPANGPSLTGTQLQLVPVVTGTSCNWELSLKPVELGPVGSQLEIFTWDCNAITDATLGKERLDRHCTSVRIKMAHQKWHTKCTYRVLRR
ncbi:uncharacterized protein LOC115322792 [Ixodes scapularis]|uniref:uncharacterized protein LOC115322792 n=1 Tax=Ixodes scapularis TaxID=6945 RepID=UPI001C38D618|nr:uncharacterized protein LOC115322792 [Ixodes scapularis]